MALTEYQLNYFRQRYVTRVRLKLCVQCGKELPIEGRSYGEHCKKLSDARYKRNALRRIQEQTRS